MQKFKMSKYFSEYIFWNNKLASRGGRRSILRDREAEVFYEKLYEVEEQILKQFGLPYLLEFRELIFDLFSEADIDLINTRLSDAAAQYLVTSAVTDKNLLLNAKARNLKSYEVLPELGIKDFLHSMFYYEEYFKKDKMEAEELIELLRKIDDETAMMLKELNSDFVDELICDETRILHEELSEKQIPYLAEFVMYTPAYPY